MGLRISSREIRLCALVMSARLYVVVFLLLEHAAAFAPTNAIELLKRPAASRALPCLMAIKKKKEVAAKGKTKRKGSDDRGADDAVSQGDDETVGGTMTAVGSTVMTVLAGCEPVFQLASREVLANQRVGSLAASPTYESVLAALLAAAGGTEGDALEMFVQANRDLLDYRFFYRLTADMLRADNTGDTRRAATLRDARARAVKSAQLFDTPLFKEVGAAEGRLGGVLAQYVQGRPPAPSAVLEASGDTPMAAFAFWFVTIAAMSAWKAKLNVAAVADQAQNKLRELAAVRAVIESAPFAADSGITALAALLELPNPAMGNEPPETARRLLAELEPEPEAALALVRRLGCTYCQASRHGFKAYNPAVQHLAALHDVLLYGQLQPLLGQDIRARPRGGPEKVYDSQMVQVAYEADTVLKNAGFEIPLFW
jgi:hypothetical protein